MGFWYRITSAMLFGGYAMQWPVNAQFNNPPGVEIWCGKAYQATNASFNPGGWLEEPPRSEKPLLNLKIYPRMNIYVDGESDGAFLIDASLSYINGEPYENSTYDKDTDRNIAFSTLIVEVSITETGEQLIGGGRNVTINSTSNELEFALSSLPPRFDPYEITLFASSIDGSQSYVSTANLSYLPSRTDGGSITKLDNLYGGLLVQDYLTNSTTWSPILPYSYYTTWDSFLALSPDNLNLFKSYGYNIVHIIPPGGPEPFNVTQFDAFLDRMDELQLWLMYDMRHTYQNDSSLTTQVNRIKSHKSLLLWYTADEPDGVGDPLDATVTAYNRLRTLDPYHPTSLVLNCYNFHYAAYAAGADIILEDVYPIGINATHSIVWDTPCNSTYGDCGCDDCEGRFEDISTRLDRFVQYQDWLGERPKTFWGVPQAFGNESYWPRYPTPEEEAVMGVLRINHGAKGIVAWNFPTTEGIRDVTGQLAKALTMEEVTGLILGARLERLEVTGRERVDVAGWRKENMMVVSIVSLEYDESEDEIRVELPVAAKSIKDKIWRGDGWEVQDDALFKKGLESLEVTILMLEV